MAIIRASALVESRWRNGAGRKADIAAGPGWLVGFAWLERDAPFSDYAGHDRTITLLDGGGFALALPEGALLTVDRPEVPAAFDGKGPIDCRLTRGPCTVLNAITAYPAFSHRVQVIGASDLAQMRSGPGVFLVVLHGSLTIGTERLGPRDTLQPAEAIASPDARIAEVVIELMAEDGT